MRRGHDATRNRKRAAVKIALAVFCLGALVFLLIQAKKTLPLQRTANDFLIEDHIPRDAFFIARWQGNQQINPAAKLVEILQPMLFLSFLDADDAQLIAPAMQSMFAEKPQLAFALLPTSKSQSEQQREVFFFEVKDAEAYRQFLADISNTKEVVVRRNAFVIDRPNKKMRYMGIIGDLAFITNVPGKDIMSIIEKNSRGSIGRDQRFIAALGSSEITRQEQGYIYGSEKIDSLLPEQFRGKVESTLVKISQEQYRLVARAETILKTPPLNPAKKDISQLATIASRFPDVIGFFAAQNAQELIDSFSFLYGNDKAALQEAEQITQSNFFANKPYALVLQDSGSILPAVSLFIEGAENMQETRAFFHAFKRRASAWFTAVNMIFDDKNADSSANIFEQLEGGPFRAGVRVTLRNIPISMANIPLLQTSEPFTLWYGLNFRNQLYFTTSQFLSEEENSGFIPNDIFQEFTNKNPFPEQIVSVDAEILGRYLQRIAAYEQNRGISQVQRNGLVLIARLIETLKSVVATSVQAGNSARGEFYFTFKE